ncbi:hypothetical protein JB92DRAFT_2811208 [Gautieria morchelliformis]|nr:hypothetical protein JB92DRAFT_2811208 [Gautieria morchelliformis]
MRGDSAPDVSPKVSQEEASTVSITRPSTSSTLAPPWIRSASVELWIDQEGFRSIQPKFDLAEYWRGTGLSPSGQVLDVVEFIMKSPQTWHFHYAMLDSPPVLRRLTVNGDMNDYISRQAALTLKYNGINAVESTEDKGKLAWKFEYLVEDRRDPETGKIMEGEKRFTPLNFVCNPELLTSEHGKKVKLLHFVKKSVTPKLQSFNLGLPATNCPPLGATEIRSSIGNCGQRKSDDKYKATPAIATSVYSSSHHTGKRRVTSLSSPVFLDTTKKEFHLRRRKLGNHQTTDGIKLSEVEARHPSLTGPQASSELADPLTAAINDEVILRPGQRIVSPSLLEMWFPPHRPRPEPASFS